MDNSLLQQLLAPSQPQAADLTPGTPAYNVYLQRRAAMEKTAREQGLSEIPPWIDDLCKQQALQSTGTAAKPDGGAPYAPPEPSLMNLGMGLPQTAEAR